MKPIIPLILDRWSPRAYSTRLVEQEDLLTLLEAARWAPSSANEQPWRYFITRKGTEAHAALGRALAPGNQRWALEAPVLVLTAAVRTFARTGAANPHAFHDTGAATLLLSLQAAALGMAVHQMGGYDAAAARTAMNLPENMDPVTVFTLGYPGEPDSLPEDLKTRELAPRTRRTVEEIAYFGTWTENA